MQALCLWVIPSTDRTNPLAPGRVSRILAVNHDSWGALESAIIMMSPSIKFLLMRFYFCLCCINGKYSLTHRVQNKSEIYCICLHRHLVYRSSGLNKPGGKLAWILSCRRWLGVSGSRSLRSFETVVNGRLLSIASTSHKIVWSPSSSRVCCLQTDDNVFFTRRISLSQTPPWCGPEGGFKIHETPFCCTNKLKQAAAGHITESAFKGHFTQKWSLHHSMLHDSMQLSDWLSAGQQYQ